MQNQPLEQMRQLPALLREIILLFLGAALAMGGWALAKTIDHESRIAVMEQGDLRVQQDISQIKSDMRVIRNCVINHAAGELCTSY